MSYENLETTPTFEDDALRSLGLKHYQTGIDDYADSMKQEAESPTSPTGVRYRQVENVNLPDHKYL